MLATGSRGLMFRRLHIWLTALYLLAAVALLLLIGVGTYRLVDDYFQSTTDLALQHKMAHEFILRGVPLPVELATADKNWYATRGQALLPASDVADTPRVLATATPKDDEGHDQGTSEESGDKEQTPKGDSVGEAELEDAYIGELAAVFTLPLDANGQVISDTANPVVPIAPDQGAVAAALQGGLDWRTVRLNAETRVRFLTYRLQASATAQSNGLPEPAVLQLGRALGDQDAVLGQLMGSLLTFGGISLVLLGISSWWLAGRSLRPAEQAWSRQQLFVANASHELRAPLTLMRASTEVALRTLPAADKGNRALLDDVLQETDHMTRLVEDLLLLSRLDAHRLKLESKPVAVQEMLSTVQRQVSRLADERGVRLLVGGGEGSEGGGTGRDPIVLGDATRLRQVLLVLLDNALRHTPAGGSITLTSSRHGRYVQIGIADTGSGIAPEHIPHLFERFYQADSSRGGTDSEGEGSGLGLAIAKGLVEAQHGHISISSKLGQGTQVTISLPSATK